MSRKSTRSFGPDSKHFGYDEVFTAFVPPEPQTPQRLGITTGAHDADRRGLDERLMDSRTKPLPPLLPGEETGWQVLSDLQITHASTQWAKVLSRLRPRCMLLPSGFPDQQLW